MKHLFSAAIFALLALHHAAATTYFVDAHHKAADDAGKGVFAAPFKTVSHAAAVIAPGDTVIVATGKYYELAEVKISGTKDKKITFKAAEPLGPVMWGFKLLADHIRIEGFTFTNTLKQVRYDKEVGVPGVYAGETFYGKPEEDDSRTGTLVYNCHFYDIGAYAVVAGRGAHIKGNYMYNCHGGVSVNDSSLVEDNEVNGLMLPMVDPDYFVPARDTPQHKQIWRHTKYMFFYGDDITFRNNYLHGVHPRKQSTGICFFSTWDAWRFGPSHNILIERNRCEGATHVCEPSGDFLKQSSNITFRGNLFMNTVYVGVYCKEWTHIVVENNTFINCGAYPVWFQSERETHGSVVKNNIMAYYKHDQLIKAGLNHTAAAAAIRVNKELKGMPDIDGNLIWGTENKGYGKNDLTAEPVFIDPDNGDFRLAKESPGQGAGANIFFKKYF